MLKIITKNYAQIKARIKKNYAQCAFWGVTGAIMFKKEGLYENVFEYDINSMYPHLMTVIDFITRKGKYKIVDKIKLSNEYAIYRCVIKGIKDNVMRHNPKNYYTTLDVKTAIENNYNVELIQDGEPNCLVYSKRTRFTGNEVFGKVVKALYAMKMSGCKDAKVSLNYIWGFFASKSINEVNTYQEDLGIDDITNITKNFIDQLIKTTRNTIHSELKVL